MKKFPSQAVYQREKGKVAIDYAPEIYPCQKCGYPVAWGYCCNYCGDTNPSSKENLNEGEDDE